MALVSASELSALRTAAESAMPGTAVIWRRTLSADGAGGQSGTLVASGTVACRAVPRRGEPREVAVGGRVEARADWYLYVPHGTDVREESDYVVVAGAGTFDILGVHAGRAYEPSRRIVAVQRT